MLLSEYSLSSHWLLKGNSLYSDRLLRLLWFWFHTQLTLNRKVLLLLNLLSFLLILERKFRIIHNKHVFVYFPINCFIHHNQLQRKIMLWILKGKYLKYPWIKSIPTVSKWDPPDTVEKEQESYKTSRMRFLVRGFQSTSAIGFV